MGGNRVSQTSPVKLCKGTSRKTEASMSHGEGGKTTSHARVELKHRKNRRVEILTEAKKVWGKITTGDVLLGEKYSVAKCVRKKLKVSAGKGSGEVAQHRSLLE